MKGTIGGHLYVSKIMNLRSCLLLSLIWPLAVFAEQPGAVPDGLNFRITIKKLEKVPAASKGLEEKKTVVVRGAVMKATEIDVKGEISVADAVHAAGGIRPTAVNNWIRISSPSDGTSIEYRGVTSRDDFRSPEGVALLRRITLRNGDVLNIPEVMY
ncbi:MAG: hypothetical protein NTV51_04280 [Verrucomicrobia bacterium]|nr:hypothetical protein [Verrucomicrobiota bacterium]